MGRRSSEHRRRGAAVAIYHLSVKPLSRGAGRSATAASAYRAAERLHDEATGETFDYTRKRGVEHTEIVLPAEAVRRDINWARDRAALWNAAEEAERRKDARVAREYEVALPHELTGPERVALVRAFSQELAERYGCAVDLAIHCPHRSGDARNYHAHILATTREVEATGLGAKTAIELKDTDRATRGLPKAKEELTALRERWGALVNERLAAKGHDARIDHRSLDAQGLEREPTTHKGPAVTALERRGVETEVGRRIEWQRAEEAQARLERASEMGRVQREASEVERSIVALSTDIEAARRERDRSAAPKPSLDALRQQGRDAWLEYRRGGADSAKENEKSQGRDHGRSGDGPDDDHSL